MTVRSLEETAQIIFGPEDPKSIQRWVTYWRESRDRNRRLLDSFSRIALVEFSGKTVLDIGCGTGGLAEVLSDKGCRYVGADYHPHILRFASMTHQALFVRCNGTHLPFEDDLFDYVAAFDVIEHLVGGVEWQIQFLREIRRVMKPLGMVLLTTPNFWYPYDAHTDLYGPQYLPARWADAYISNRNPGFIREHKTFSDIQLMSPRRLRHSLKQAGLEFLHDLPCGLDRSDYTRHFPIRGLLAYLGFGWYPHAEFWGILVRRESKPALRLKLPKNWYYERNQPSPEPLSDFGATLNFDKGLHNPQLGSGWFWHERDRRGFRWTSGRAVCFLQSGDPVRFLEIEGFSPRENHLQFLVDGTLVGEHPVEKQEKFQLRYLVPFRKTSDRILEVEILCASTFRSEDPSDDRDLGVMIFRTGLSQ